MMRGESGRMSNRGGLRPLLSALLLLYAAAVSTWALAHHLVGDGYWLLALVNAFALYLFAPLPLAFVLAVAARRWASWLALALVVILFLGLFGAELTPPLHIARAKTDVSLTVMTYNVHFANRDVASMAATVQSAAPDVIAFQEMTVWTERALVEQLGDAYPYRTPAYAACYAGVVIWSRFPLTEEEVGHDVLCRARMARLDLGGRSVRVVGVHAWPYTALDRASVERTFRWRREQIEELLAAVAGQPEPLIFLADLNSTPMHDVYRLLRASGLGDAFREAGWGFGHTYPASGGRAWGLPFPGRLVRIDHVLHSREWRADRAWVAPWDGQSDHLAVVAQLSLRPPE
jgi:vancomycin resistance protein VanJ